jgi:hypothetical protein
VTVFMCESGGTFFLCVTPHDSGGSLSASNLPQNRENKDDISCTFLRYSLAEPRQERTLNVSEERRRTLRKTCERKRKGGEGKGKVRGRGDGGVKGDLRGR